MASIHHIHNNLEEMNTNCEAFITAYSQKGETAQEQLDRIERDELYQPVNGLKHDIEQFLPYFVFVERDRNSESKERYTATGNISFCGKDKAPLTFGSTTGVYAVERMRMVDLLGFLRSTMPMENEDNSGWIIPLYEGNDFASQEELNAYFHNLMYWESMLPASSFGPLTLRYGYALSEFYGIWADSLKKKIEAGKMMAELQEMKRKEEERMQERIRITKKQRERLELERQRMELRAELEMTDKRLQTVMSEQNQRAQMIAMMNRERDELNERAKKLEEDRQRIQEELFMLNDTTDDK